MRAILALAFIGAVLASTDIPIYQYYTVTYSGTGCTPGNVAMVDQYYSYTSSCTTSACTDGPASSYKYICVQGAPKNLGVRRWDIWSTCTTETAFPLVDGDIYTEVGVPATRGTDSVTTWKVGCNPDQSSGSSTTWYNLVTAPAAGGATVNYGGYCGTDGLCTSCSSGDYILASGTVGCDDSTDGYIETTQTFPTISSEADIFEIDYNTWVFASLNSGCCKINGDCLCCVADGDSCCNPSELYSTYNTCCDDNSAVANNTLAMKLFQACLCDQNGEERGTYDATTNTCTPNDTDNSVTANATLTSDMAETACDYLKVFAWCNAHALQDEQYYEDIGDEASWETNSEFVGETQYYYIGATGASEEATGADPCFTFGGMFQPSSSVGTLYDQNLVDFCDLAAKGIQELGFECDAFCASGNTLAFAALLAFF